MVEALIGSKAGVDLEVKVHSSYSAVSLLSLCFGW